ncbi:peptidoglycan editing factor PgeF [Candidatus Omnitrophota bacterium]
MKKNTITTHNFLNRFKPRNPCLFIAAFSDKRFNCSFRNLSLFTIRKNRKSILGRLKLNVGDLVLPQQVHGKRVVCVDSRHRGKGAVRYACAIPKTDGLITAEKNLPIAVLTADCLPIFIHDPQTKTIAVLHAGWKSTHKKIVSNALKILRTKYKSNPKDLMVVFGPAMRKCCYEVGKEFKQRFPRAIIKRGNKIFLDLIKANTEQLTSAGIKKRNIIDCKLCTCCDKRFFSYRREGKKTGRMLAVIALQ